MRVPFPALKTMVTVFLLLMGNTTPVHPIALATISSVASIAASVIGAGTSVASTAMQATGPSSASVGCTIQVENWTRYGLMYPTVLTYGNPSINTAPTSVLPAKIEAFAVGKPRGTATGVAGTVSWELVGARRRFVLMWSAPFSFDFYYNWMGVGMTKVGLVDVAEDDTWFHQMYSGVNTDALTFKREKFYYDLKPVIYRNDKFEIVGFMTNVHKAQIKVVIRPTLDNSEDLADAIRTLMAKQPEDFCNKTAVEEWDAALKP